MGQGWIYRWGVGPLLVKGGGHIWQGYAALPLSTPNTFNPLPYRRAIRPGSHDQETYHQSRYKPKNATDTPYHFKEAGDQLYRQRKWKQAADSYSEACSGAGWHVSAPPAPPLSPTARPLPQALKRDATFMTALCNRSACWLRLHQYRKCIDDANLALNLIGSSPASSTTGVAHHAARTPQWGQRSPLPG